MRKTTGTLATMALLLWPVPALRAGSLQVSPIGIEVIAPAAAATLRIRNDGDAPVDVQIRVLRWSQKDGEDKLEATEDVVASPPMATLTSHADYTVRLVRLSKQPVANGECYRLLVDELPSAAARKSGTVALVLRYSIPAFFYPKDATPSLLTWTAERRQGRLFVTATNRGDRHVRVSSLRLQDHSGASVSFGDGLVGYVLGNSSARWQAPDDLMRVQLKGPLSVTAQGNQGAIHASISMPTR